MALQLLAAKGVPSAGEPMHVPGLGAAGGVWSASSTVLTAQMCPPSLCRRKVEAGIGCSRLQTE